MSGIRPGPIIGFVICRYARWNVSAFWNGAPAMRAAPVAALPKPFRWRQCPLPSDGVDCSPESALFRKRYDVTSARLNLCRRGPCAGILRGKILVQSIAHGLRLRCFNGWRCACYACTRLTRTRLAVEFLEAGVLRFEANPLHRPTHRNSGRRRRDQPKQSTPVTPWRGSCVHKRSGIRLAAWLGREHPPVSAECPHAQRVVGRLPCLC